MKLLLFVLNFLSSFIRSKTFTGVLPDTRSLADKNKDWAHEERDVALSSNPFSNTKPISSPYPYENQFETFSCVPHAVGLALAIERKQDLGDFERIAPIYVYRQRSNYPGAGSILQNIFELYRTVGAPLFTTLPTPQTEYQANTTVLTTAATTEAQIFKGYSYWTIKDKYNDINTLAALPHAVSILIFATQDEWGRQRPEIQQPSLNISYAPIRHCVTILPNSGFIENGIKYVVVQDSAWFGGFKLREVSEEFISKRCYGAGYWDKVVPLGSGAKPHYIFTKNLKYGDSGPDVRFMQQLFVAEGLLPNDCITGNFYGRTLAALHAFQAKYAIDILIPNGLTQPTDVFGPSSRAKATSLCV